MSLNRPFIIVLLVLLLALAWWQRRAPTDEVLRQSRLLMGTVVEITVLDQGAGAQAAVEAAFAEMARIEMLMSSHAHDSEVARFNRAAEALELSAETAAVVAAGLEMASASGGAFDPGLGLLYELWGVEGELPRVPADEELDAALRASGYAALRLEGQRLVKAHPELRLDLGGIAKGYAVDRAVELLSTQGIRQAAVNAGGDLRLLGARGDRPWRIAIQHPRDAEALLGTVELSDRALVTSGDYERYFEVNGIRYHHLLDPATGQPARRCQSVTVAAPTAMLADALATAMFVLGPQEGLALLANYPESAALVVDAEGGVHLSSAMAELLR